MPKPITKFRKRTLTRGARRVALEYIGEGIEGDFDPSDLEDYPHLRFTLFERVNGVWQEMQDGSYCTLLPTSLTELGVRMALDRIMAEIEGQSSVKRIAERLSWLSEADLFEN